jgi:hypothetical protein
VHLGGRGEADQRRESFNQPGDDRSE